MRSFLHTLTVATIVAATALGASLLPTPQAEALVGCLNTSVPTGYIWFAPNYVNGVRQVQVDPADFDNLAIGVVRITHSNPAYSGTYNVGSGYYNRNLPAGTIIIEFGDVDRCNKIIRYVTGYAGRM